MSEIIYGLNPVKSRLQQGQGIKCLVVKPGRHNKRVTELVAMARSLNCPVETAPLPETAKHQGVMLHVEPLRPMDEKALLAQLDITANPLLLALDGVTDPGNLGACLRSAAALGVAAVILPKDNTAPLNQATAKAASGALDLVPIAIVTNLARTMKLLKAAGVWFVATDAEAETPLATLDLTGALCLVMGAEGSGLRRKTQDSCDYQAAIPTADPSLPLNVSVATGICLYEAHKQRTQQ